MNFRAFLVMCMSIETILRAKVPIIITEAIQIANCVLLRFYVFYVLHKRSYNYSILLRSVWNVIG